MRILWFGHACFGLVDDNGFAILTDPPAAEVGLALPQLTPDAVTISHEHYDHNSAENVKGRPAVFRGPGSKDLRGLPGAGEVRIRGVDSRHDDEEGRKRGPNTIFIFDIDGVRVTHLGDLGHRLTPDQLADIGHTDVLLVPVGGTYTLDAKGAFAVMEQLKPTITIPMHYLIPAISIPLATEEEFTRLAGARVERVAGNRLAVSVGELERTGPKVIVLGYGPTV